MFCFSEIKTKVQGNQGYSKNVFFLCPIHFYFYKFSVLVNARGLLFTNNFIPFQITRIRYVACVIDSIYIM